MARSCSRTHTPLGLKVTRRLVRESSDQASIMTPDQMKGHGGCQDTFAITLSYQQRHT